ncbi:alkaline phosphatase family protein [Caenimonas sp. SL110]|uniref:alkaline phosphatase family protein n=1 Tax=Caenimonas sp. SL110 TaxID=1450524 RepID=UPI00069F2BF4|nr:alkaline phosphatase family protein [Caenimonas sp. SL110]
MKSHKLIRTSFAALVCALLASCATPPATPDKPKLVVLLVVDGLPQRQVLAYRDQLAPDGFARFLDRGAWFADAQYGHAFTVTAAGHATMLTGAYPHRTGIIGNEWRDQATGEPVYNTGDTSATYLGNSTRPLDGTSPRNLKAETVGDVLRRLDARSKVIAISGKDRGAILPAGKTGTAYMYMGQSGQFASTSFYMPAHPTWVTQFNGRKLADTYFKTEWKPVLPEAAYARSVADNQPWYGPRGGKLPMMMGVAADDVPGPAFYSALLASPFADALSLEFARAAIAGEGLGRDDAPDLLAVSLSGHDYVNHRFSAESRLSHDHFLHLDRMLQSFLRDLDATVGKDNYIAVLTADHGFMPAPEFNQARGVESGRISSSQMLTRISAGLVQKFGEGKWLLGASGASLLLDKKLIAARGVSLDAVAEESRRLILLEPSIGTAYTRAELLSNSRAGAPFFEASRKAWHPDVAGEVQFTIKPNFMFGSSTSIATHGSPHPYDTHVPILVYGPKWVRAGRVDTRVEVVDIAPSLSRILGVAAPAMSEGRQLPLP